MEQTYKNCQSCGIPFKKSSAKSETNTDKSVSNMFCGHCYENGDFKQPDWTVSQMQEFVRSKIQEMPFYIRIFAGMFIKRIPKLKRWAA